MEMLYGILADYRRYLINEKRLSSTTAKTYYNSLCRLLENQNPITSAKNFDINKILNKFKTIKHKNQFSQSKNALLHFCEHQKLEISTIKNDIENIEKQTHKKYKTKRSINYNQIKNTINHIKNKTLRLSYQTMFSTGMRVFEVSQIKKENVIILEDNITFKFIAKGGQKQYTKIYKKEYPTIYNNLKLYIGTLDKNENVFYSTGYLQNQAKKYNFQCHDLRRIFAKKQYQKTNSKNKVMKMLRHKNIKTTNIYLKNKIHFLERR